ncbi:MAG TPA: DUF1080 domain-containing protein [Tepidisphaeraceae bacterium]|nr:DUF1080 domain-containing protein [Tepidisphaeraceae bacterium]
MRRIIQRKLIGTACVAAVGVAGALALAQERLGPQQPWSKYRVHDMTRPAPPVVTPGTPSTPDQPGKPPSDATVLFDGKNLDNWTNGRRGGGPMTWKIEDGVMVSGKGNIYSKQEFGDAQIHVEWAEPTPPEGKSQERGNSGVFLMGRFEMQVLDNYGNPTYPDGQCGGIYGQYPPQVNACLPPGQWQTYDFIFHRPRYKDGKLVEPAYVTTFQNGVLLQDHQRIEGPTGHMIVAHYPDSMPEKGPLGLQDHKNPIRFRNVWVRPLEKLEIQQHTGQVASGD